MINFYKTEKNIIAGFSIPKTSNREKELIKLSKQLDFKTILFGNQIHSGIVLDHDNIGKCDDGDGIICFEKNILLGIFTADCVPVTVFSNDFIGIIHAGWKGFTNNIFENFFKKIKNFDKNNISSIIGPCICKKCYEVDKDVAENFNNVKPIRNNKFLLNLKKEASDMLKINGIAEENIFTNETCTFCSSGNLPSYRKNKTDLRIINFIGKH